MRFGYTIRRAVAVGIAVALLQGCVDNSFPAPDETSKVVPPQPPKKIQDIQKKKGRPIPKSIKDRD